MGTIELPVDGIVYVDSNCVIHGVERIAPYDAFLHAVWNAASSGDVTLVTSELTLLESLVMPVRSGDARLEARFREFLCESDDIELLPIDRAVIDEAIRFRASLGLKVPDAIHIATAHRARADLLLTNDTGFRRASSIKITVLSEQI